MKLLYKGGLLDCGDCGQLKTKKYKILPNTYEWDEGNTCKCSGGAKWVSPANHNAGRAYSDVLWIARDQMPRTFDLLFEEDTGIVVGEPLATNKFPIGALKEAVTIQWRCATPGFVFDLVLIPWDPATDAPDENPANWITVATGVDAGLPNFDTGVGVVQMWETPAAQRLTPDNTQWPLLAIVPTAVPEWSSDPCVQFGLGFNIHITYIHTCVETIIECDCLNSPCDSIFRQA